MNSEKVRNYSLMLAEAFDAWRVVPRIIIVGYSWLVINLYMWYRSIPTYLQERCDHNVLQVLLNNQLPLDQARAVACTVVDVVGGPTAAQSAFVTTIIGLSAGIFGLYTTTGRKWEKWTPDVNPIQPPIMNWNPHMPPHNNNFGGTNNSPPNNQLGGDGGSVNWPENRPG